MAGEGISVNDWAEGRGPEFKKALEFVTEGERKKLRRRLAIAKEIKGLEDELASLDPVLRAFDKKAAQCKAMSDEAATEPQEVTS